MNIDAKAFRGYTEALEKQNLSRFACCSADTKGREVPISSCDLRTEFQRDRDRIIHCKSFRRLKHKTQVFLAPMGDHYRTRLTHTLEVSQIARTIARALRLNEDLTEAIAMGHDLGHTPFGHAGEFVLDQLVPDGFEHNLQSLRVVELLENGKGLNLTLEVRDGIKNHKKNGHPITMEGKVVSMADRIAYINHDIDDAVRAGVLKLDELPAHCVEVLGYSHGERINSMILDIVTQSFDQPEIIMSDRADVAFNELRDFMFEHVYLNPVAKREEEKAKGLVKTLFEYYMMHLEQLPAEFQARIERDGSERITADWIACMTDRYAISEYERIFVPKSWI